MVALQTPISGLTGYPLGTFTAQDFSMSSADVGMTLNYKSDLNSWNTSHQNLSAIQHSRFSEMLVFILKKKKSIYIFEIGFVN